MLKEWTIESKTGYKPQTYYWKNLSIAECAGLEGIMTEFKTIFRNACSDVIKLTELSMILQSKFIQHYNTDKQLAEVYDKLHTEVEKYANWKLEGDDLVYYFKNSDIGQEVC